MTSRLLRLGRTAVLGLSGLVLAAATGCAGCSEDAGIARLQPRLELEPESLAFDAVPVGATKRLAITVRNTGSADLELTSAETMAPFVADLGAKVVRAGADTTIDVGFTPGTDEEVMGTLLIVSTDPARPMVSVPLSGRGATGLVAVRPAVIDLTNTPVGTTRTAEIFFSNLGVAASDGQLVVEGFTRPEHFTLTGIADFSQPSPFGVPARSEVQLVLEYRPLAVGADDGHVVFEVCGERCGIEVKVHASGAQAVVTVDPPVVDFGTVGIGMTVTHPVVVQNGGTSAISVLSIAALGSTELSATSVRGLPASVDPNSSMAISLEYHPTSAAQLQGELVVHTDDALVPEAHVRVIGHGEGPLFLVQPEALAFGVVVQPATYRRSALLLNAGSADVRVESLAVSGDGFALAAVPGLPLRLGSGESLVVNVTFSPVALGAYEGALAITTDDPANAAVTVPLSGARSEQLCQLDASTERLNFGLLPVGYARVEHVTLTNAGTDPCVLVSGAFRAPIDAAITVDPATLPAFPVTLAPGQQVVIGFGYAPTEARESKANFVLTTADAVYPERHLSLLGSAEGYVNLFTRPERVDFGTLKPGCSAGQREVRLYNAGTAEAIVDAIRLISATSAEITLRAPATPVTVAAGSSLPFELTYAPTDYGVDTAAVELIVRNLPYAIVVPVVAEGSMDPRALDQFVQSDHQEVDVLFVIDNSCSMEDDQNALAANFRTFIQQATVRNVNFHLGITTTTVFPIPGAFIGPVMTRATSRLESEFQRQAAVGIFGSGIEQGLDAVGGALQLFAGNVAPNQDFRRSTATLVAIIVSDEDDQSNAAPLFYTNLLRTSAMTAGYLTAVVSGQASGCGTVSTVGGGATPAPRYEEFVALTQGISESICSDWATTLAHLGNAAFGLKSTFVLSQDADTTHPIVVRVNNTVVPSSQWTYDPTDHAIHFVSPPPERATITVEYSPTC